MLHAGAHLICCAPANPGSLTPDSVGWVTCSHSARCAKMVHQLYRTPPPSPLLIPSLPPRCLGRGGGGGMEGRRWGEGSRRWPECPILVQFPVSRSSEAALRRKVSRHRRASSPAVVQNWPMRLRRRWYWRQADSMAPKPKDRLASLICSAVAVPSARASLPAITSLFFGVPEVQSLTGLGEAIKDKRL